MADDLADECKTFRNDIETEDTVKAEIKAEEGEIEEFSDELKKPATTPLPFAVSSTGSLMPQGLSTSGIPNFASPMFSPFYPAYPTPNAIMAAMAMSPQYQAAAQSMIAQNMFMTAMANMKLNSPKITPAYSGLDFGSSKPGPSERKTPKRSVRGEHDKERIKKPLNSFMIYKQEMRKQLLEDSEFQNKHSAEINTILGQRWHMLNEEEQKVYYDKAAQEKLEHEKKYPGWSAKDNYTFKNRRAPRKHHFSSSTPGGFCFIENGDHKRCRALYGVENQAKWCRHCKVKKRCLLISGEDLPDVATVSNPIGTEVEDKGQKPSTSIPLQINPMISPFGMPYGIPGFGFPTMMEIPPLTGHTLPQSTLNSGLFKSSNSPDPK